MDLGIFLLAGGGAVYCIATGEPPYKSVALALVSIAFLILHLGAIAYSKTPMDQRASYARGGGCIIAFLILIAGLLLLLRPSL